MKHKVVINIGKGNFELSLQGIITYLALSGKPDPFLYKWDGGDWYRRIDGRDVAVLSQEEKAQILVLKKDYGPRLCLKNTLPEPAFFVDDTNRHDPALVQMVEILGSDSWGPGNTLFIQTIEENTYRIVRNKEGRESIITPKSLSWVVIPEPNYYYGNSDYDDWD